MSDFWSTVLGNPEPQPSAPTPPSDLPWWQRTVVDVPAPQASAAAPEQHAPAVSEADIESRNLKRTQWSRESTGNCPGCGSANYDRHPEAPTARPRCFDCGYPITQMGSGMAVQGEQVGPVKAARQTEASRTNNFNPRNIVHHMHPQQKG